MLLAESTENLARHCPDNGLCSVEFYNQTPLKLRNPRLGPDIFRSRVFRRQKW